MDDPDISDILVNTSGRVYVEKGGRLEPTEVVFSDDRHLLQVIGPDRVLRRPQDRRRPRPWSTHAYPTGPG